MPTLPRAILFDLDDTILSFGNRKLLLMEVAEGFAQEFGDVSAEEAAKTMEAAFAKFWADEERHRVWRFRLLEARILVVSDLFKGWRDRAPGLTDAVAYEFSKRFNDLRDRQAGLFPGALETIDELLRGGVKLALVTNGHTLAQRKKVDDFDLARRFRHVQVEEEMGFGKPDSRAYTHAMAALGVEAHETWMVGDNLEWEVAAPQRLGIFGIWHDHLGKGLPPGSDVRPDRIIRRITELLH